MMAGTGNTIAMRRIDRAVHELRGGYPVLLTGERGTWLAVSAEALDGERCREYARLAGQDAWLVISGVRAARVGLPVDAAHACAVPLDVGDGLLAQLIDPLLGQMPDITPLNGRQRQAVAEEEAALALVKLAALLPAVAVARLDVPEPARWSVEYHILTVKPEYIAAYKDGLATTLTQVSAAHVPLKLAEDARVLAFRPRYGAVEHLAICIGEPEKAEAPLVRVHSSCVTGDILGSLRCDCGEQLQEAIARMAREGSGIVLYMSQEGRGIGIVNKLRAYQLQDAGLDTLEANEEMGFAADERTFDAAAAILKALGVGSVRLLSNNPDKVTQLQSCGITVRERVSLALPPNPHNRRYLETKEKRCGHVF